MSNEFENRWSDHDPHDSDEYEFDDQAESDDAYYADDDLAVDEEFVSCPACHQDIHELAEQCPHCGEYITLGNSPWAYQSRSRQRTIKWVLLLMIGALVLPFLLALWQLVMAAVANE